MALLQVTKAYRTTSTDALHIIAGVLPIDLLIEARARAYKFKRNPTEGTIGTIYHEATQKWKARWETTPKGRATYEFFRTPQERLVHRWINPDHYTTQFISGHGDFKSKLKSFQLSEEDTCDCGMEETLEHVLEVCRLFEEERQRLRDSIQELELPWPREKREFVTKDVYPHFQVFARSVLLNKERKRRTGIARNERSSPTRENHKDTNGRATESTTDKDNKENPATSEGGGTTGMSTETTKEP